MNIFLTGFMGSGKTSTGKMLAEKFSFTFIDMDEMIEKKYGKTIKDIFYQWGETEFREIEKNVLNNIIQNHEKTVVATGGGTPCFFDNMKNMNKNGITIYLKVTPEKLFEGLLNDNQGRPVLAGKKKLSASIVELLAEREKFYNKAKFIVEVQDHDTIPQIIEKIQKILKTTRDGN